MVQPNLAGTPHEPITNVRTEAEPAAGSLLRPPTIGEVQPVPPATNGTETIAGRTARGATVDRRAPDVALRDIGSASFADGVQLEIVHGADDRVEVGDTLAYPWSATASLLITARDGSQWVGTGWFVGPQTLVTAGHCVYITNSPVRERNGWVLAIQVMPGRHGTTLPFGAVTSSRFWTVRGWADDGDQEYDYGAIVLPTDLGTRVGTFGVGVYDDDLLTDRVVNVAGYPADKRPGTLWYDARAVASTTASKIYYDIDTAGGQSGAPVYVVDDDARRIGVAIHAYGGAVTNSGTRISASVFRNIQDWSG